MSSTNKTKNLKLNSWLGADIPKREDFNSDNNILDNIIYTHNSNTNLHTSSSEKAVWNEPYYITTYTGNGSSSRTVSIGSSFTPTWGIVFRTSSPPSVIDIQNEANYNYFALFSNLGSESGVTLSGKNLSVMQSSTAVIGNEYRNFNENGKTYVIIAFR